jgi:hypothetical protein
MTSHTDIPTNADLMRRLNLIVERHESHEKRIASLEADRAVVHRLAEHVRQVSQEVTVVHALLARSEESVSAALRQAGRELASQVTAAVRAELSGVRGEMQELRAAIEARPCLAGGCAVAPKEG